MRKHPCNQDCPRRSAECRRTCPEYAEYAQAKQAEYAERKVQQMIKETEFLANRRRTKNGCFLSSERKPIHSK